MAKDGTESVPKRLTAEAAKSRLRAEIMVRFQVDVMDSCLFPEAEKKWKAFVKTIVAAGKNETEHHEEVNPVTMIKIYKLLGMVVKVLKARGTPEYEMLLVNIPTNLQGKLNMLLQWGAMFVLMMFEVRRG